MGNLAAAVRRAFAPAAGTSRIGAEVELFTLDGGVSPGAVAGLPTGALVSLEPGGQLEVSLAPRASVAGLVADVASAVRSVAMQGGVHLSGTHPTLGLADRPLMLTTPRYLAMQALFDRTGPEGRMMMRLTASLQVCVDRLPGRAGAEQWLVANLAGPALAATYANSPVLDGRPSVLPGARTAVWWAMDRARTGYDGRHLDPDDPLGGYLAFARAAERLPVPEADDDTYHLGTLFPPVRPRPGYLELRFLDAQPLARVPEVLATVWTLLHDAEVRRAALEVLLPTLPHLADRWAAAARGSSPEADDLIGLVAPPLEVSA